MTPYRLARPPRTLQRPKVHLDNLALVPANLLPYKEQYQHLANDLPKGSILILLPETDPDAIGADQKLSQAIEKVATLLQADGQRVTTISANEIGKSVI